jgi:hypothetical protein
VLDGFKPCLRAFPLLVHSNLHNVSLWGIGRWRDVSQMLILKYFAAVGTMLTAGILALNAYLEPSNSAAGARVLRTTTTASMMLITPKMPTPKVDAPDLSQPKVAAAPTPTHSTRHRNRAR